MTTATVTMREVVHELLREDYAITPERITDDAHLIHDFRVTEDGNEWQLLAGLEEALGIEISDGLFDAWLGLGDDAPEDAGTVGYLIDQLTMLNIAPEDMPLRA